MFCDITGPLKKKMIEDLSAFIKDESKKKELLNLAKKENAEEFSKIVNSNWTIIDVIEKYNVDITPESFFMIVPRNLERYYTIASSALLHPDKVTIALSMTCDKAHDGTDKRGVTSAFVEDAFKAQGPTPNYVTNRIFIKESLFHMPPDPKTPVSTNTYHNRLSWSDQEQELFPSLLSYKICKNKKKLTQVTCREKPFFTLDAEIETVITSTKMKSKNSKNKVSLQNYMKPSLENR
jgi:hypothetical protein